MRWRRDLRLVSSAFVLTSLGLVTVAAVDAGPGAPSIDNVVVIVVDDMAVHEMIALPKTQARLGSHGVTFTNSFVNTSNCCPSRATFITGQRSSNHGVQSTDWRRDDSYRALNHDNTLPVWLSGAGFETIHVGKYLNGYGLVDLDGVAGNNRTEVPPGWTDFHAFVGEKKFVNFDLSENGTVNEYRGEDNHQTDVLARVSAQAVTDAVADDKPFFMWVTPFAPHTQSGNPPVPAARHTDAFHDVELPSPENFNEPDVSDKPGFVRNQPLLTDGTPGSDVGQLRELYAGRLRSLLAVDDLVESVWDRLDDEGVLDNTLVVFSSDNGYLMGNHRLEGKIRLYEESIRVPLLMAGGPFRGGVERDALVSNLDLAPTILQLLGVNPGLDVDGIDLSDVVDEPERYANRALIIESAEGPGYDAVRTPEWMYAEYLGSARELYDMVNDSQQMDSLHRVQAYDAQEARLAALLGTLRACTGSRCALDANGNQLGTAPRPTTTDAPTTVPTTPSVTTTIGRPTPTFDRPAPPAVPVIRLDRRVSPEVLVRASRLG